MPPSNPSNSDTPGDTSTTADRAEQDTRREVPDVLAPVIEEYAARYKIAREEKSREAVARIHAKLRNNFDALAPHGPVAHHRGAVVYIITRDAFTTAADAVNVHGAAQRDARTVYRAAADRIRDADPDADDTAQRAANRDDLTLIVFDLPGTRRAAPGGAEPTRRDPLFRGDEHA